MPDSTVFLVICCISLAFNALVLLAALFKPQIRYRIIGAGEHDLRSPEFCSILETVTDSKAHQHTQCEVLTNGENFYPAELEEIRQAQSSVHLEAYIFSKGEVAQQFITVLAERARAGVEVRVVLDGLGSFLTSDRYLKPLTDAGGKLAWYDPIRWHTLSQLNHRTHRELLVIDGKTAFIGGAGIADHWLKGRKKHARWRDTVLRVSGDAVASLQSTFIENWTETYGEVLASERYFPFEKADISTRTLIVNSTPSPSGGTRSRVLFETLMANAKESIHITSPYFLPDDSSREVLTRAVSRGVRVQVIAPGRKSDHVLTRQSSRRLYGELLRCGIEIHEYRPAMIHAKILIVDGVWSAVGSTNFDERSFGINDEVNLVSFDESLAARLRQDFVQDLAASELVTLERWKRRPMTERFIELFGWVLQRQQ
jgi:cardiolipin synthase